MSLLLSCSLVRFTYLYDHQLYGFDNNYIVKHFWMLSYKCAGTESRLDTCVRRLNYDAKRCGKRRGYVFLRCGTSNLQPSEIYWGSIRVVSDQVEQTAAPPPLQSLFRHVHIYGAGVLHRERVAAVQTTYMNPSFHFATVRNSANHAFQVL